MEIHPVSPDAPPAQELIALSDRYMAALYPAESNHLESVQALMSPEATFFGCFVDAIMVGCGAAKILHNDGSYGEIKRLFVLENHRGQGLSRAIMLRLETHLLANGTAVSRLETGIKQPEARRLYEKLGYAYRAPFGNYRLDPLSVFMEKRLKH